MRARSQVCELCGRDFPYLEDDDEQSYMLRLLEALRVPRLGDLPRLTSILPGGRSIQHEVVSVSMPKVRETKGSYSALEIVSAQQMTRNHSTMLS